MEELAWEPSVDAAEIGVSAESGIVTLSGIVKSLPQKWAAEKAAQRVLGVKAVTDEIVVKLPGDSELSDTEIAGAAVNALDWNASVPRGCLKVVVTHGWITLEGTVQFHYERVGAEYAVRGLTGVKGVTNLISVKAATNVAERPSVESSRHLNVLPILKPKRSRSRQRMGKSS